MRSLMWSMAGAVIARSPRPGKRRRTAVARRGRGRYNARPGEPEGERQDMAIERTFSIIKPDATRRNLTGKILTCFEDAGLRVVAQKRLRLSRTQAEGF